MKQWVGCGVLAAVLVLSGCSGSDSDSDNTSSAKGDAVSSNTPPVAEAGAAQNVATGTTVTLDGSDSSDSDGDTLTYIWTFVSQPPGSAARLEKPESVKPRLVADVSGAYVVQLRVNDGQGDSAADQVTINVAAAKSAPVANAGIDQQAKTGRTVQLDGSASADADGDDLGYRWTFTQRPSGSTAELSDASAARPTFEPDVQGEYRITLKVNDGQTDSAADEVLVSVTRDNSAPVADAGTDQNVVEGDTVALDGAGSLDADGDTLSYQWQFVSRPQESSAALSDNTSVSPEFTVDHAGDYVVRLVVLDGVAESEPDNVVVTATRVNARPTADAGADQNVVVGDLVTLDGSGSRDADGDMLEYQWAFISRPAGSGAQLSDVSEVAPMFTADAVGDYVLALVVDDGAVTSESDRLVVNAAAANVAPMADAGADDNVATGALVTLNGSSSRDANGDTLTYDWQTVSIPASSTTTLVNTATATPSFTADVDGRYVFELVVSDGTLFSTPDRVQVAAETANSSPLANAGDDQRVVVQQVVMLDGSGSRDADNDALTYTWSFQSRPSGSTAVLSNADAVDATFTPDAAGGYVVNLRVSDGEDTSLIDTVRITAVQPEVRLERYDEIDREYQATGLPYRSTSNVRVTTTGSRFTLARFRISATGQDYTIRNLRIQKTDFGTTPSSIVPSFVGLQDEQTITADRTAVFSLESTVDRGRTVDLTFAFEVAETGETFTAEYTVTFN